MSLKKVVGLLAGFALAVGLIGAGVGAVFTDSVTAKENINVGTFSCGITTATTGATYGAIDALGYAHSVSYTAPTIMSSAAGSAPFFFTVKNTGSIADVLTVATSPVSAPWSIIGSPFAAVPLAAGASTTYNTGVAWTELSNANIGQSGTITWTVNCGENTPTAIFDNHPATLPSNLPSFGVEAYYYDEWGAGVTFAAGPRQLSTATVTMSSWACETGSWTNSVASGPCVTTPGDTYSVPITFKVYNVGASNAVGSVIASVTQTFAIPYRPSYDATHCSAAPGSAGLWWDGTTCKNGLANNITFTFAGQTLPNTVIFGIAYNTSTNGYGPLGPSSNGPVDSLNIATYPGTGDGTSAVAPAVGTWLPDGLSVYAARSTVDTGTGVFAGPTTTVSSDMVGPFGGLMPAVQIVASY